jgi:hypothetical protein
MVKSPTQAKGRLEWGTPRSFLLLFPLPAGKGKIPTSGKGGQKWGTHDFAQLANSKIPGPTPSQRRA